jgi:uncharacterized protein DUF4153
MATTDATQSVSQEPTAVPETADRRMLLALAGAAVVGAAALPIWRVGIGWPLAALALLVVVLLVPAPATPLAPGDRIWRGAAGAAALVLAAVPAVRASGPLAALCLLAALLLASYALTGGRSWIELLASTVALIPAAFAGLGWTATGASSRVPRAGRITLGALAGVVLLLVFGALLRGADPVFADLIDSWVRGFSTVDIVRIGLGGLMVGWLGIAMAQRLRSPVRPGAPITSTRGLSGAEWVIPVALLDLLFGLFVVVQLTVLFGGDEYVLGVGGPDYAVYAKGGFTQLTLVTVLTLGVVAGLAAFVRRESTMELGLIRALGGVLCGLTLVIVASSLKRLSLYADAYGFTWPRLLGFAGEVWLGLIFVLVLVAGVRLRAGWLPRAVAAAGVGVLLALVAVNPEALMARTALARYQTVYPADLWFVRSLSVDALDGLQRLPAGRDRDCVLATFRADIRQADPWYGWNLSRARARDALAGTRNGCYG